MSVLLFDETVPGTYINWWLVHELFDDLAPRDEIQDLGAKLAAQILLADQGGHMIIPNREEWIGVGLLERDDELKRR